MSLSDEPEFLRNCPVQARNDLEPIIREFIEAIRKQATPSIQEFIDRVPGEHQPYLLHELLLEQKEALGPDLSDASIERYRREFANFPEVLDVIFGPVPSGSDSDSDSLNPEPPAQVGRYRIIRRIGKGGFGVVYLADDTQLDRQVALKAPRADRFQSPSERELFINEAKTIAKLGSHPNIVTLYDILVLEDQVFIVQEYIQGDDLRRRLKSQPDGMDQLSVVKILIEVVQAMAFAHEKGFYHRDIKPENILLDTQGVPKVADFGLAIHEDHRAAKRGDRSGSPHYMSPERIRGEAHRIDGRSDLWSLGVVLYELLTGRRPFRGQSKEELAEEICHREPVPMRQWRSEIPEELERICATCLAKTKSQRYSTAHDLIDDLQSWLENQTSITPQPNALSSTPASSPESDKSPAPKSSSSRHSDSAKNALEDLVPKGLRAFDREDQGVIIDLLPGPRDRAGLPLAIRFWKTRLESQGADSPMAVGVLYGPSGSGKTSMVKAGVIPRLSSLVQVLYVESYDQAGESKLRNGLFKALGQNSNPSSLAELAGQVRSGKLSQRTLKLILVLDQFEQWFSLDESDKRRWIDMLRQCDGVHLSTLLMIRDDFWMQTTRLMRDIEVPMVEDINTAAVDLLSMSHAQNVLRWFGSAYGCLPGNPGQELSKEHQEFLSQAIERISDDGKVIPVKLTMFVEMMRDREWAPKTLQSVGGFEGLGVVFLEELFNSKYASAEYRYHQEGAKSILNGLLPKVSSSVRDCVLSLKELEQISGYENRPEDFQALLTLLDRKLKLITPTDAVQTPSYKLTHDYLIPSVREWSTLKKKQTARGRAELTLLERAESWSQRKENRYLPSLLEWLSIRRWTRPKRWNNAQKALMRQSDLVHASRLATLAGVLATGAALAWWAADASDKNKRIRIDAIQSMDLTSWSGNWDLIPKNTSQGFIEQIKERWRVMPEKSDERLRLSLALLAHDDSMLDELLENLDSATSIRAQAIYRAVGNHKERVAQYCHSVLSKDTSVGSLGLAGGLAQFTPTSELWADQVFVSSVANALLDTETTELIRWMDHFEPVGKHLLARLSDLILDRDGDLPSHRLMHALEIVKRYADNQEYIHNLLIQGPPIAFEKLFVRYSELGKEHAQTKMRAEIAKPTTESSGEQRANAALALLLLGQKQEVVDFLTVSDDPERLTHFIFQMKGRGIPGELLVELIDSEISNVPFEDSSTIGWLKRRSDYLRLYGLLLGLGQCEESKIPPLVREGFRKRLVEIYGGHPSRCVHSATGWLMKRWGLDQELESVDRTPIEYDPTGQRQWYVVKIQPDKPGHEAQFLTMLVFSADDAPPEYPSEIEPGHIFALCDREVTWGLYHAMDDEDKPDLDGKLRFTPVNLVSWLGAVDFCGQLTRAARERPDRRFRLPRGSEWCFAASAGMTNAKAEKSAYGFGDSERLLSGFEWYHDNANRPQNTAVLPPTPSGLFDIHGNVSEWIHDVTVVDIGSNSGICEFRGTNYDQYANQGKVTFRSSKMLRNKDEKYSNIGFRLCQTITPISPRKTTIKDRE